MRNRVRCLPMLLLAVLLLAPGVALPRAQAEPNTGKVRPGRVWVRLRNGSATTLQGKATALQAGRVERVIPRLEAALLRVPPGQEAKVAEELARRQDVVYALPVPEAQAQVVPNDPSFYSQWGLTRIAAPQAWDVVTDTAGVTIAVLDTGADLDHPDLVDHLWTNTGEVPGNGKDDEGNGFADDVHGAHFYAICSDYECLPAQDGNVADDNGHGTHVAGIAAAATDNGVGVAGVSWNARIMPVKVLDSLGNGYYDDITLGILYAAENGARVINMSLGGADPWPPLQEALAHVRAEGALVVAAAGNTYKAGVLYPAAYPEAMAVAATDSADRRASLSSYGPEVNVAAPGVGILSTCLGGGYCTMQGTSMATPHVAGLAALIWAQHPEYTPEQVQRRIEVTAVDVNASTLPGRDDYLGYGRIDAARAVWRPQYRYYLPWVAGGD